MGDPRPLREETGGGVRGVVYGTRDPQRETPAGLGEWKKLPGSQPRLQNKPPSPRVSGLRALHPACHPSPAGLGTDGRCSSPKATSRDRPPPHLGALPAERPPPAAEPFTGPGAAGEPPPPPRRVVCVCPPQPHPPALHASQSTRRAPCAKPRDLSKPGAATFQIFLRATTSRVSSRGAASGHFARSQSERETKP